MRPGERLARYMNEQSLAEAKARREAGERHIAAVFAAAAAEAKRAYERPGNGRLMMTRSEWETFDELHALWDEMERKYGRLHPQMFSPTMQATARRIF